MYGIWLIRDWGDARIKTNKILNLGYNILRKVRARILIDLVSYNNITDIGAGGSFLEKYFKNKNYEWYDNDSKKHYADVEKLSFKDNSKEVVLCCEVLEHLYNPVKAIKELKRVYKKQLIITIPNEPIFSLLRLSWEKEHLWAITPKILKHYLGEPILEKRIIFKRYYIGVWERD